MRESRANGKALREVMRRWQGNAALDDTFAKNIATALEPVAADLDPHRRHDQRARFDELPDVRTRIVST